MILKMPALRVKDLIEVLVEEHAAQTGRSPEEFPIREIGIRPGEKLHEVLLTEDEAARTREEANLFVLEPEGTASCSRLAAADGRRSEGRGPSACRRSYDSALVAPLSKAEIRELLLRGGVFTEALEPVEAAE